MKSPLRISFFLLILLVLYFFIKNKINSNNEILTIETHAEQTASKSNHNKYFSRKKISNPADPIKEAHDFQPLSKEIELEVYNIKEQVINKFKDADLESMEIDYESNQRIQFRIPEYRDKSIKFLSDFKEKVNSISEISDQQKNKLIEDFLNEYAYVFGDFGSRSREFVVKIGKTADREGYEITERQFIGSSYIQMPVNMPQGSLAAEETISINKIPSQYKHIISIGNE